MKIFATILGSIFWLAGTCQVLIVDNNPTPLGGSYTTLQAAYDSANDGDTVYISPSATSYGNLDIGKELVIFGGGFNPDTDFKLISEVGVLNLNSGASKTVIGGLKIHDLRLAVEAETYALDTIRITHCYIDEVGAGELGSNSRTLDSLVFINNIFGNSGGNDITGGHVDLVKSGITLTGTYFYNNIFVGSSFTTGTLSADTAYFYNNLFFGEGSVEGATSFYEVTRSIFENNIFYGRAPSANVALSDNVFNHNLSSDSTFASVTGTSGNTGISNIAYTDPLFENVVVGVDYDLDFDLSLKTGSPAISAGSDGTDVGPTGGMMPFDPTGTVLPTITGAVVPSVVVQGADISITISGKGN